MADGAADPTYADALDRPALAERLARHPILRPLGQHVLHSVLTYAQLRTLRARGKLFAAGDPGHALYLVLAGWVKLSRPGENGRDIVLDLAGPGSLFGELAVLCNLPRAADATALSATRLLAIDGRALIAALRASPDALLAIIELLGGRLARTTTQVADSQLPAEPRLARALLHLAALDARPAKAGLQIDLGLSQSELGDMTGLARESINKLLSAWRDQRIIALQGRAVIVLDLVRLQAIGEV